MSKHRLLETFHRRFYAYWNTEHWNWLIILVFPNVTKRAIFRPYFSRENAKKKKKPSKKGYELRTLHKTHIIKPKCLKLQLSCHLKPNFTVFRTEKYPSKWNKITISEKIRDGSAPCLAYNGDVMCSRKKKKHGDLWRKKGKKNYNAPRRVCLVIIKFRWKTQLRREPYAADCHFLTFEGMAELEKSPRRQHFLLRALSHTRCWPK